MLGRHRHFRDVVAILNLCSNVTRQPCGPALNKSECPSPTARTKLVPASFSISLFVTMEDMVVRTVQTIGHVLREGACVIGEHLATDISLVQQRPTGLRQLSQCIVG